MQSFGSGAGTLSMDNLCHFLDIDESINDVVVGLFKLRWFFGIVGKESSEMSMTDAAKLVKDFGKDLVFCKGLLSQSSRELNMAALSVPLPLMASWVDGAMELQSIMEESILELVIGALNERSKAVDQACPRWGQAITDAACSVEMAKVMLMENPRVRELPEMLAKLWTNISQVNTVGIALCLSQAVSDHPNTKESIQMAMNSLSFGKLTVKVAAGIRAIVSGTDADKKMVLEKSKDMPQSIIDKLLEEPVDEHAEDNPKAAKDKSKTKKGGSAAASSGSKRKTPPPPMPPKQYNPSNSSKASATTTTTTTTTDKKRKPSKVAKTAKDVNKSRRG